MHSDFPLPTCVQVANAMKDPEIQQILQDPVINNVLKNLQENPQAAQG